MLFKILHGDKARISTDITPYHEGYCYVTYDGDFYVDMNNERVKLSAKDCETLMGVSLEELRNEFSTQDAVILREAQVYTDGALAQAKASGELKGEDGADGISVTHTWNGTTLTVTSASGTSSADLKGEKGDQGEPGAPGEKGVDGAKGDDGYTPVRGTDYWTDADKAEIKAYIDEAILNSTNTVYVGTDVPASDVGTDGDIYIVRGDAT